MEEKPVKHITDEAYINKILKLFSPCLYSLSSGKVDRDKLAKKFAEHGTVLILLDKDSIAAFSAFYCNDVITKTGYLSMIAVLPEYTRQGYGTAMINEVFKVMKSNEMDKAKLEVQKNNDSAIQFYRNLGFHRNGEETVDSFYMEKNLNQK